MSIEDHLRQYPKENWTLADAWVAGWVPRALCLRGERNGPAKIESCGYSSPLSLATLIWTRGACFPCWKLANRLKCPRCGWVQIEVGWFAEASPYERATHAFHECTKTARSTKAAPRA